MIFKYSEYKDHDSKETYIFSKLITIIARMIRNK